MIKLKNGIHLKDGIKFNSAIPYTPQDYFDTNNNTILHFYPTGRGSERPEVFVVNIPPIINGYIIDIIGAGAFKNCNHITSIIIPPNVTSIDNGAFEGCINLVSITIPYNVSVGSNNLGFDVDYEHYNYQGGTYILQGTNWILQQ